VCNFECLSVADVRALIAVGSVRSSIYVERCGMGGGAEGFSAAHCMPANSKECRNVHEVRTRAIVAAGVYIFTNTSHVEGYISITAPRPGLCEKLVVIIYPTRFTIEKLYPRMIFSTNSDCFAIKYEMIRGRDCVIAWILGHGLDDPGLKSQRGDSGR
jgi:hypothetical protein